MVRHLLLRLYAWLWWRDIQAEARRRRRAALRAEGERVRQEEAERRALVADVRRFLDIHKD